MVFGPKFNKFTCAKGCFLGTEYTPHGRWQFFQQLGSHDTQKHSLNDLKSSEVKFSKLLLGEILLKVHKNATDVNQCGKSRIQLPHKFSQPSQKTTSIRIFYFNYYSLIKDLYRQFCQFLRETFQDLQIAFFPFNTVFPLNIILYQLSYSPGNQWFTIQQKKDGILHDLFRRWRYKSCANSLTISLKRIIVINHRILYQSQSQVTATLPTKHWLTKKSRRCILHVHLLGNY